MGKLMKIIFEIPMRVYQLCGTRFGLRSKEYSILQNGVISRDASGSEFVQILCDADSAGLIREKLAEVCPDAAAQVRERQENASG
jgi:hypothetical protein